MEGLTLADDGSLISKGSSRIGIAIGTEFKF